MNMKGMFFSLLVICVGLVSVSSGQSKGTVRKRQHGVPQALERTLINNQKALCSGIANASRVFASNPSPEARSKAEASFKRLLAPDLVLNEPEANLTGESARNHLTHCSIDDFELGNFEVFSIDKNAALLTHKSTANLTCADGQKSTQKAFSTTIWVRRGNRWVSFYNTIRELK